MLESSGIQGWKAHNCNYVYIIIMYLNIITNYFFVIIKTHRTISNDIFWRLSPAAYKGQNI